MATQLNLEMVRNIITLIDKVKNYSVKLNLLRTSLEEELGKPISELGEDEGEKWKKALQYCVEQDDYSLTKDVVISTLPPPKDYIEKATTLEELKSIIEQYIKDAFTPVLVEIFNQRDTREMGTNEFYNELPLNEAEAFIEAFHELADQPEEMTYGVTVYDLNDELWVDFETEEEAREFAKTVAPSTVFFFTEDCAQEIDCY